MDTNRIKVYNHDLSTATIEAVTEYTGFTVVKAPKGPKTPIRLNANSAAKMQDIFGKSSADYPELFEAEVYNSQYDMYLSAPYGHAKVPAAYLTNKGFFLGTELVEYNDALEFFAINGYFENELDENAEESALKNITEFSDATFRVLQPMDASFIYCNTQVGSSDSPLKSFFVKIPALTAQNPEYAATYRVAHLPYTINDKNFLDVTLDANGNLTVNSGTETIGKFLKVVKNEATDPETGAVTTTFQALLAKSDGTTSNDSGIVLGSALTLEAGYYFWLYGAEDSDLTPADIEFKLDEPEEQKALKLYKSELLTTILGLDQTSAAATNSGSDSSSDSETSDETEEEHSAVGDAIYAVIIPKFPSSNTLHISFKDFNLKNYKPNDPDARNILSVTAWEDNAFHSSKTQGVTFTGSLDNLNTQVSGFNATNITYSTQNLVAVVPLKAFKDKSELDKETLDIKKFPGYGELVLENGIRETDKDSEGNSVSSIALHDKGWEKADDPEYSDVDLFFSCERCILDSSNYKKFNKANSEISKFFRLADKHPYAGFLFNATLSPKVLEADNLDATYQLDFGPSYWNICNELVVDLVDGSRFMSTMIGSRAIMQTRIIEYKYGGVAPEFTNTGSPSMGGQLPGLVSTKLRFKYTKDQQDQLDEMNFNPVVSDRTYGLMLTGQKTCKEGDITDWSYIGHVSAFLNFEKEVKAAVMDPQVGKPNNPYYRELRKFQAEEILSKRLTGATRIWAAGVVDTSTADGVNDVQALRARQFRIKIAVKVDTFSEYVILDFTNVDQGTEL